MSFHNIVETFKKEIEKNKTEVLNSIAVPDYPTYMQKVGYVNGLIKGMNILTSMLYNKEKE